MKTPLQVYLDDVDMRGLESWADEHGISKSEAVRIAIRALTHDRSGDALLSLSGAIRGLPSHASEQVDRYLAETFDAPQTRSARKPRSG